MVEDFGGSEITNSELQILEINEDVRRFQVAMAYIIILNE